MTMPPAENIHWLMGREGGIGLAPLQGDHADCLLLVLGNVAGAIQPENSWLLGPQARDGLFALLARHKETGVLMDPGSWPTVHFEGAPPSL